MCVLTSCARNSTAPVATYTKMQGPHQRPPIQRSFHPSQPRPLRYAQPSISHLSQAFEPQPEMPGQVAGTPTHSSKPLEAAPHPLPMAQPFTPPPPPRLLPCQFLPSWSISSSQRPSPGSQGRLPVPHSPPQPPLPLAHLPLSLNHCSSQVPPHPSSGKGPPATMDSSPRSWRGQGSK